MIIYYTESSGRFVNPPEPVLNRFSEKFDKNGAIEKTRLLKCPAFIDRLKNTFAIKSIHDYELSFINGQIGTSLYGEEYFKNEVIIRSPEIGFLTWRPPGIIFFAESPCVMTQLPAYYENNEFVKNTFLITGGFDIGKHFRGIESGFIFKGPCKIKINEGDPLYYVHFNTSEKIEFKPFIYTKEIHEVTDKVLQDRGFTKKVKPLQWWYDIMSKGYKQKILEIIKKNLLNT